jgi:Domain of Unknown Function (DUF1080)
MVEEPRGQRDILGSLMRIFLFLVAAGAALAASSDSQFNGRWDITVPKDPRARAWWLEVAGAGTSNVSGKFVGAPGGQMDVIPQISVEKGELKFVFPKRYGNRAGGEQRDGVYRARLAGGRLHGSFQIEGQPDSELEWTGVRAPEIKDQDDGSWKPGKSVELFDGRDLNGWHSRLPNREIGWRVEGGVLKNNAPAPDLVSDATFWNFMLHVAYKVAEHSNSGIGLRGRYEVQIFDDAGNPLSLHGNGALYSRILPTVNASRPAGEWQTFDIRLIGRQVTIVLNDRKIIDKQEIEGLTAIASDPAEAQPGPFILQGDHGPVEFRKIVATPLTK